MIAIAPSTPTRDTCQDRFLAMLPKIVANARFAFRRLNPEAVDDAVAEVTANAFVAFARLVELGRTDLASPQALASFAIKQYWAGRRVANRQRSRDVLNRHTQRRQGFSVHSLDGAPAWEEAVLVDTRRAPVPDTVAFRVDFRAWLDRLPSRQRRIARRLTLSYSTTEVALYFHVSVARVSQLRRELQLSWELFSDSEPSEREKTGQKR